MLKHGNWLVTSPYKRTNKLAHLAKPLVLFSVLLLVSACGQSPNPTVTDLISISPPSFADNSTSRFYETPSKTPDLRGKCDPRSYGIEYSTDKGASWVAHDPGCSASGTFTLRITVEKTLTVWARAKTKYSATEPAVINVRYILPPTSASMAMVAASHSGDFPRSRLDFTMSGLADGAPTSNGTVHLDSGMTGIVYGKTN